MMRSESRTEETSGIGHDHAFVGVAHRHVAPRSIPAGLSQITQSNLVRRSSMTRADALFGQRILVAGLRGRKQPQILQALVSDQGLRQLGVALHHIDEVKHHAPLRAHYEIEVAQSDVKIHDNDLLAILGERRAECGCRRGLSNAAFA